MTMQTFKENSLDFFSQGKIEKIEKTSTIQVLFAMLLYTLHQTFNIKRLIKLGMFAAFVFGMYSWISSHYEKNAQEEKMAAMVYKENINIVNGFSQEKMNEAIAYLDASRDKEIARLTQTYWIIKYLDKEGDLYGNVTHGIQEIQAAIVKAKEHYASRKLEVAKTYNLVKEKKYDFIKPTYDDKQPLSVVVELVNAKNLNLEYVTPNSAKVIQGFMAQVEDPEKLNVYFAENQEKMKQDFVIFEK